MNLLIFLLAEAVQSYISHWLVSVQLPNLWSKTQVFLDKAGIWVVLYVVAIDVMFQMKERTRRTINEFQHRYLQDIHLMQQTKNVINIF